MTPSSTPTPSPTPTPTPSPTPTATPTPTPVPTPTPTPSPQTPHGVVISQIFGGGGNSGSPFRNDYVELFNRGGTTVVLDGWSVQYAGASGTSWQKTTLSGSIAPGRYYLIQQGAGTVETQPLPTPDATGGIALSATAGKVLLVSHNTTLSGACPSDGGIVDVVGYGSGASCFEGTGRAPAPSNTTAIVRASGGCTDTDDNAADFSTGTPAPRNGQSPAFSCASNAPAQTLLEARTPATEELRPPYFVRLFEVLSVGGFSGRLRRAGSTRWRRDASASDRRDKRGVRPRCRGAWP